MSIGVEKVRTDTMKRRIDSEQRKGVSHVDACELCRKPVKFDRQSLVAIDHEQYEFVTEAEASERGEAVSLFPVGSDCAKRIMRALSEQNQ